MINGAIYKESKAGKLKSHASNNMCAMCVPGENLQFSGSVLPVLSFFFNSEKILQLSLRVLCESSQCANTTKEKIRKVLKDLGHKIGRMLEVFVVVSKTMDIAGVKKFLEIYFICNGLWPRDQRDSQ